MYLSNSNLQPSFPGITNTHLLQAKPSKEHPSIFPPSLYILHYHYPLPILQIFLNHQQPTNPFPSPLPHIIVQGIHPKQKSHPPQSHSKHLIPAGFFFEPGFGIEEPVERDAEEPVDDEVVLGGMMLQDERLVSETRLG